MDIAIAANNGEMGGGEVMLLNIARAVRSLGHRVTIVGPEAPSEVVEAAQDEGFDTVTLPATNRKAYMAQLRVWDKSRRRGILWCNGLIPSLATAGHKNRIVHLHQIPEGAQKLAATLARRGALKTLVPSDFMADQMSDAEVFNNWVPEYSNLKGRGSTGSDTFVVGFLGRISEIKGTDLLAEAIFQLNQTQSNLRFKLMVGGEARFVSGDIQSRVNAALNLLGDSLEVLGWVDPQEFFNRVDCVVMPSQWDEPFGLVAVEAMSARKPLVVTRSGALPSIVGDSYPWIAEKGNAESIAQVLLALAQETKKTGNDLDEVLSRNYWRWYENFSPEAGKARLRELLEEIDNEG
ncbi:glycosyltransferase family 4 protein [Rothia aerolata]|uniref:D-inositol 3-phosphate glycosyltransferase n=1 Tax=Rothia aerolata TaxID=1812262 RepID=A0A917MVF4_9MICC|nr:glycosyltransferase family 4 protein [Rothia aerolata]GGH62991.1 hypothetical protein GCM10007359_13810 [Rothia aerolata]